MTQGASRTTFGSSRLVRVLAELTVDEVADSKQSFAERLGQWLDIADALSLYSALNAGVPQGRTVTQPPTDNTLRGELARVRAALATPITTDGMQSQGRPGLELPAPEPGATIDSATDFAPYHRYYIARQRDIATAVAPLRAAARKALAGRSPRLRRLAELDALMEEALAPRERNLLATIPALLGKRFEALLAAHRATLAQAPAQDDPRQWMQPDGWLALFRKDLRAVLLAELALRLQPVEGLIAALDNEVTKQQ